MIRVVVLQHLAGDHAHVVFDEVAELDDSLGALLADLRKPVLDLRRNHRVAPALDEADALEPLERLRQHLLRDPRDVALEIGVAQDFVLMEGLEDERAPQSGDRVDHVAGRTARVQEISALREDLHHCLHFVAHFPHTHLKVSTY